jgi:Predicted metal-dependent hydrolase with the TIM-barrel fold
MTALARIAVVNARIWTGNARRPWAEAILMEEGKIELVGSSAEVRKRISPPTPTIDARGMLVMPGWSEPGKSQGEAELLDALAASVRGNSNGSINVLQSAAPANLVIFDRDITRANSGDVALARVVLIIEAGRVVVDRAGLT